MKEFRSSLIALVRGPAPPSKFLGEPYFRDCWIDHKFPKIAFATAIVLQVLLILFPPPIWNIQPTRPDSAAAHDRNHLVRPAKDFPAILPALRAARPAARKEATKPLPRGANTSIRDKQFFPSRCTDTSTADADPAKSAAEAAQDFGVLPNIVQLAGSQPERPKLQLTSKELTSLRPKTRASLAASNLAAPEIAALEKQTGAINIASSSQAPAKPLLPVNPMSAPHAAPQKTETNATAPDIGGRAGETETLIALSATPAPAAPPAIPAGNLSARVSISPDGPKPETSGGTAVGTGAGGGNAGGAGGRGPEGLFISGGNNANTAPISGLGIGRRREKPALRCRRGRFLARASRPRARNLFPRTRKGPRSRFRNWDCHRSKCSARNAFTRCTSICRI